MEKYPQLFSHFFTVQSWKAIYDATFFKMIFADKAIYILEAFLCLGHHNIPAKLELRWFHTIEVVCQYILTDFFREYSDRLYLRFGRLKLCLKTTQFVRPRACTTSSLTLAVAVAVKARTGVCGNFCFKRPRCWEIIYKSYLRRFSFIWCEHMSSW